MTDAAAPRADNGAGSPHEPKAPGAHGRTCGEGAISDFVARTKKAVAGVKVSIEKCPDASQDRAISGAALAGIAGGLAGLILRRSLICGVFGGLLGTIAGGLASQYHVSVDWDPDKAFGSEHGEGATT